MQLSTPVRWFVHGSLALLAIWLGSSYLIKYGTTPPSPSKKTEATPKFQPVNEAKFRSLLDAGNKAISNGQYSDALSSFLEAERAGDHLSNEQYDSLKTARLQLAQLYENADDRPSANAVYRGLADCAVREGQILVQAKDYEAAVRRAQDGEEFSNHLVEGKRESLQGALSLLASSLDLAHCYPEAADAAQRLIDYLKSSTDEYDESVGQAYSSLAGIQGDSKDWVGLDQTLSQYIDWCEKTHDHRVAYNRGSYIDTTVPRSWAQYNLIIARYQEGDADGALSKADDFFSEYSRMEQEATPTRPLNVAYRSSDFAALALQIARESNRQNAVDLWQKRAPGGVKVIALHPVENQ